MSKRTQRRQRQQQRQLVKNMNRAADQVRRVQTVTDRCIGQPTKISEPFALFDAWLKYWKAYGITLNDKPRFDSLRKAAGL